MKENKLSQLFLVKGSLKTKNLSMFEDIHVRFEPYLSHRVMRLERCMPAKQVGRVFLTGIKEKITFTVLLS